ncbi:hypothetical protein J40TS1_05350 [Paenibacillus montaniterrae]|uniref:YolD-like family protein n=1 Tax=Paenibacillus montaniterrae TaxID=429341 RepID=A0A919YJ83_9BACL|nr:YolD-like family protein [Paenibacillus montaniterrae]GIP14893.1 hypothetical protein J40TS1_05350 [Paenibacillus montaniterrae]
MAGKLEGNGVWKLSRMTLPEHVQVINVCNENLNRMPPKQLAEYEMEQLNHMLQQSMLNRVPLCIKMYDSLEDLYIVGVVEAISRLYGRFKVGDDWFLVEDIEAIEQDDGPC